MIDRYSKTDRWMNPEPPHGFDALFQAIPDATLIVDFGGRIVNANQAAIDKLVYLERSHLCKLSIPDVVSGADGSLLEHVHGCLQKVKLILIQADCIQSDASTFPAELSVSRLDLGRHYLVFFIRDITHRRQQEAMLRELMKKRDNNRKDGTSL